MNRLLLAGALALLAGPAFAADMMPLKAPAMAQTRSADSGFYFGAEMGAAVENTTAKGGLFANALVNGNLTAGGGIVGGCAGYMRGGAARWWGLHGCVDYVNIAASNVGTLGTATRWSATQEVRVGGSAVLDYVQAVLPSFGAGFTFPTFTPPSLNGFGFAAAPKSYFALGVTEFGVSGHFGANSDVKVAVAPMLKAGAIWQVLDANGNPNGGAVDTYARVTFAKKAIVLAQGGETINRGTGYQAGLAYYFAVPR